MSTAKQVMAAMGRRSKADDPVIAAINDLYATTYAAEKSKVGHAIYNLAKQNPNPVAWELIGAPDKVLTKAVFDQNKGEVTYVRGSRPGDRDNMIKVRIDGKWKYIQLNDTGDLLYQAWERLGASDLNKFLTVTSMINRWTSMTRWVKISFDGIYMDGKSEPITTNIDSYEKWKAVRSHWDAAGTFA